MPNNISNVLVGIVTVSINPTAGSAIGAGGWVDVGYTEDGARFLHSAGTEDIRVFGETFPVGRVLGDESLDILLQAAEATLTNLNYAMAGAVLAAKVITLGGGVQKEQAIRLVGTSPDSDATTRTIWIPYTTAVGSMQHSYRRTSKSLVPMTFRAFKSTGVAVCTISDT